MSLEATLERCVIGIDAYGGDSTEEGSICKRTILATKQLAPSNPQTEYVLAGEEKAIRRHLGRWFVPKNIHILDINEGKNKETTEYEPTKTQHLRTLRALTSRVKEQGTKHIDGIYSLGNTKLVTMAVSNDLGLMPEYIRHFPDQKLVPLLAEVPKAPSVHRPPSYYLLDPDSIPDFLTYYLIDAGSIPELTKPEEFLIYAKLGMTFARAVGGRRLPLVALSNIGREKDKGSRLLQDAHKLLEERLPGAFVGNVEAYSSSYEHEKGKKSDIIISDVVLADGSLGNNTIKQLATGANLGFDILKDEIHKSPWYDKFCAWFLNRRKGPFPRTKSRLARYGGAAYIGAINPAFKEHGSANIETITYGIPRLGIYITSQATDKMRAALAEQDYLQN